MSDYPEPRRIELKLADARRTTILERARACAIAGVDEHDLETLFRALIRHEGTPEQIERGAVLWYAIAFQLERRRDPAVTWEDAQTWNVVADLRDETADPIADAEATASVEAALATGLPPNVAGELTMAQLEAYKVARKEAGKGRGRRGRRGRRVRA